ncbi:MAG: nickel pincer cofactor biosynthesis protein LarC [Flexistipes sinusarabici]|uniref:Putative nickel insertion protein n=1 Tax=Flexistipes sinusarabici TaxID=2352 RepID=A0A5D0MVD9_FLESI|nr:nickel pincer cofactor biosynthesis protein LarC [Flexistipes sinusarabici]TYB35995.1 MAG: nickel pincer cofactor biosynthesis protein LarC [Flexistipes sinusarabici]
MQNNAACIITLIMNTLYFDMISGLAGDMTVAGLMNIGGIRSQILSELFSEFFKSRVEIVSKNCFVNRIKCSRLSIDFDKTALKKRNFLTIKEMISSSSLISEKVKKDSTEIFRIIAEAESKIHGQNIDTVHFHEVGAIDSIIDIISTAYLLEKISPDKIAFSTPVTGSGIIKSEHGTIPVPSPATMEILKGLDIKRIDAGDELTTPTGAAIIKYYCNNTNISFSGKILKTAYSTGSKSFDELPNILRILLLEQNNQTHNIVEIEANVDDMTGEEIGFLMDSFLKAGALDIFFTPIYMKKNRPAYKISILCFPDKTQLLSEKLLKESSTAGIRFSKRKRIVLDREFTTLNFKGYAVNLKQFSGDNFVKIYPEYESVAEVARQTGTPFGTVYREILKNL